MPSTKAPGDGTLFSFWIKFEMLLRWDSVASERWCEQLHYSARPFARFRQEPRPVRACLVGSRVKPAPTSPIAWTASDFAVTLAPSYHVEDSPRLRR